MVKTTVIAEDSVGNPWTITQWDTTRVRLAGTSATWIPLFAVVWGVGT